MSVGLAAPVLAEWAGRILGWLLITPNWLITSVWFVVVGIVAYPGNEAAIYKITYNSCAIELIYVSILAATYLPVPEAQTSG
jgi:hypothetical protein